MTVLGQTFCIGPTVWGHLIWQGWFKMTANCLKKLCLSHSEPTLPYPNFGNFGNRPRHVPRFGPRSPAPRDMALQLDGNGSDGPQNKSPVPRILLGMILRVMVIMVMIVVIVMIILQIDSNRMFSGSMGDCKIFQVHCKSKFHAQKISKVWFNV